MDLETVSTEPKVSDFQDLASYQSTTPPSFFAGPPVLPHHSHSASLTYTTSELATDPALSTLAEANPSSEAQTTIQVSAYVLSTALLIWHPSTSKGLRIPYRAISLHARSGSGVYLQLCLDDVRRVPDEELRTFEATLTPADAGEAEALFEALSACAELWPDPPEDDAEAGLEGGGWITAENAGDFLNGADEGDAVDGEA